MPKATQVLFLWRNAEVGVINARHLVEYLAVHAKSEVTIRLACPAAAQFYL